MTSPAPHADVEHVQGPVDPLRLAVVIGSTREGRFGTTVADWFVGQAGRRDAFATDIIDTREADLPHAFGAAGGGPSLAAVTEKLSRADAFVVVTPEYNHSYPGSLKNLVDAHHAEWQAKPVGFVSYGGISGGLRAVEHLRHVFAELHAVTVRDTVSFANPWGRFDDAGRLTDPDDAVTAAATLLDQLTWWGTALRTARATTPYGR
ncbi:NAD(P)H-dependent FMN reductase [Nocardia transvalensis]|uniref:NAD(P)H-dependent FMN reductase n=1 Tax=Nocardia transvalensis TaxID=37333 RepID=A0A7W9UK52_9NOCA|nr:NAD(P)H-dependent oxidoreductase [Nocardia transvalensis]MBB5916081.1 NAD(P)H-dependent FMN reductase [Nocardia transvalensis]